MKTFKILITAGPTQEPLDPVRYLTNASSGEMGFSLADQLSKKKSNQVHLVLGPTQKRKSKRFKIHSVTTALQMSKTVKKLLPKMDCFIATAAVSDYRFKKTFSQKKKKGKPSFQIQMVKNPDILEDAGKWKKRSRKQPILIGFALETKHVRTESAKKLKMKNLDLIIGNSPASFQSLKIKPYWLEKNKKGRALPLMTKKQLAARILHWITKYNPS